MSAALNFQHAMATETCCTCSMVFGVPADFQSRRIADKATFYCPSGHAQSYRGESEETKLKRQLEVEKNRVEMFRRENQEKERRIRSLKGVVTKTKNRVSKGVCPCCKRTFAELARHMETKHPDYTKA